MPKRGNDNAQMRREDYEAAMAGGGGGDDGGGTFDRASKALMAKRRTVSAKRSRKSLPADMAANRGSTPPPPSASSNPFANVSLTGGAKPKSSGGFSFGAAPAAAADASVKFPFGGATPAPAAPAPKAVGFALGSTPAAKENTTNAGATPFVGFGGSTAGHTPGPGFSFGGAKAPSEAAGTNVPFSFGGGSTPAAAAPGAFVFGGAKPTSTGGASSKLVERFQKHAKALETAFYNECATLPVATTFLLPLLDHYLDAAHVLETEYWKRADKQVEQKPKQASVSFAAMPTPTPKTGLFGAQPPTPAAPTPSPATTPAPGGEDGGPSDVLSDRANVAAPSADEDYETRGTLGGILAFYVDKALWKKGSNAKIQIHKATKKFRLIMREGATGRVSVNLSLPPSDSFTFGKHPHKKHVNGVEHSIFMSKVPHKEDPTVVTIRRVVNPQIPTLQQDITDAMQS